MGSSLLFYLLQFFYHFREGLLVTSPSSLVYQSAEFANLASSPVSLVYWFSAEVFCAGVSSSQSLLVQFVFISFTILSSFTGILRFRLLGSVPCLASFDLRRLVCRNGRR